MARRTVLTIVVLARACAALDASVIQASTVFQRPQVQWYSCS